MNEIEIGRGKRARRAYALDEVALVPSRRTRDPKLISTQWKIDAYTFDIPLLAAPMDSVMSPETAIAFGRLGGLGVLNLEGLWTRYENPQPLLDEIASLDPKTTNVVLKMQQLYDKPIQAGLVRERLSQIRESGVVVAGSLTAQNTQALSKTVIEAGVDLFVIRGSTVSAEHVSNSVETLNLKEFIYQLDVPVIVGGVASYSAALHLMRTGAAGVLVGFGGGSAGRTKQTLGVHIPFASAIADIAEARRSYLEESEGRYVHVIAEGGVQCSGDIVKAIAMGADAVMVGEVLARAFEAPGKGWHWGSEVHNLELPRGERVQVGSLASLQEILYGPSHFSAGEANIVGALRHAMAITGYSDLKEFQKVDVVVYPSNFIR